MKISELVNKVEPFKFEFDGEVLEGTYYKYRTTTPSYVKGVLAQIPEAVSSGTRAEQAEALVARGEKANEVGAKILTDTIKTWNAEDQDGNPIEPSYELFQELPAPFTEKLIEYFNELRTPKENPTTASPSS